VLSVRENPEGVGFWIFVKPRARRERVGGVRGDALLVSVAAAPVEGAANAACAEALAAAFGVRRSAVELDPASRGRRKRVWISGDPARLAPRAQELAQLAGGAPSQ
jgi:uncharacterized protein YggU (UPF0235/DUF167 family)